MTPGERLGRLDALLPEFRGLWHPQPFREPRPAWCAALPELAGELLALDDATAEGLNDDAPAALALLARYRPEVAELALLAELPRRVASPAPDGLAARWAWEIPGRKRRQIEAFATAAPAPARPVLDWCGGKGHLGRLLALHWRTPVTTLEIDPALCAAGEALAERQALDHEFLVADALTAEIPAGRHAVALHACGELHRRLIEGAADAGLAGLDVAPCCYHRGIADAYRPLSGPLRTELSRDDTRLAVTETVTASPRLARQRDREMAWKLAFAEWQRQTLGAYRNFRPVPAAWFRAAFPEFLAAMAERAGLPPPSAAQADECEAAGWRRQREVIRLSIVRHAFRRALEVWLALDLAVHLENRGYAVQLGSFCARELTPRNLLLSARR